MIDVDKTTFEEEVLKLSVKLQDGALLLYLKM